MNSESAIDFNIRYAWLLIARMYNGFAKEYDLSISSLQILLMISDEGTNVTKLGPRMGMTGNSLSRSLKKLEKAGLIYRKSGMKDKREVRTFLTKKGFEKRSLAYQKVKGFNEELEKIVPEEEKIQFLEVMKRVQSHVQQKLIIR